MIPFDNKLIKLLKSLEPRIQWVWVRMRSRVKSLNEALELVPKLLDLITCYKRALLIAKQVALVRLPSQRLY